MVSDQLLQVGALRVVADSICRIQSQLSKVLLQYASVCSAFRRNALTLFGLLPREAAEATCLGSLLNVPSLSKTV